MWLTALVTAYCVLIVLASLAGGWLPSRLHLTHTRTQMMMSFVGGLMLGVAVLHLLPHAAVAARSLNVATIAALAGLVVMFLLIRLFHVHTHGPSEIPLPGHDHSHDAHGGSSHDHASCNHDHAHAHDHGSKGDRDSRTNRVRSHGKSPSHEHIHAANHEHAHDSGHEHAPADADGSPQLVDIASGLPIETVHRESDATVFDAASCHRNPLSWIGLSIGLSLHTLIDGMAVGASVLVEAEHAGAATLAGIGTFLAVLLHKPLDAMSITSVMAAGGSRGAWTLWVNIGFSLICPLGVVLFMLGAKLGGEGSVWMGYALGFAAGAFLCIALSDLLPEVQFHSHDKLKLSCSLLAGVALAAAIGWFESAHQHEFPAGSDSHVHEHSDVHSSGEPHHEHSGDHDH